MNKNPKHCTHCGRFRGKKMHLCGFQKGGYKMKVNLSNHRIVRVIANQEPDVSKQPHYTQFKIQPIEFIEANNLSYSQGNVIKYVCRYGSKDGIKDLQKIKVYVDYLIQKLQTGTVKP